MVGVGKSNINMGMNTIPSRHSNSREDDVIDMVYDWWTSVEVFQKAEIFVVFFVQ